MTDQAIPRAAIVVAMPDDIDYGTADCPALLRRRIGRGSLILCTYPVEHMAALTPQVNPGDTVTLYDALARYALMCRLVTVDDPRVACDTLTRDDGTRFAVLASHADEPLTVKPALGTGSRLIALDGTEITAGVNLDPFGSIF